MVGCFCGRLDEVEKVLSENVSKNTISKGVQ